MTFTEISYTAALFTGVRQRTLALRTQAHKHTDGQTHRQKQRGEGDLLGCSDLTVVPHQHTGPPGSVLPPVQGAPVNRHVLIHGAAEKITALEFVGDKHLQYNKVATN